MMMMMMKMGKIIVNGVKMKSRKRCGGLFGPKLIVGARTSSGSFRGSSKPGSSSTLLRSGKDVWLIIITQYHRAAG